MHDFAKLHVEDWAKRHGLLAGIALLFAATLAWLGAFGSHDFEPFARVGYWTVIFLVQYGLAAVTMPLLRAWPPLAAGSMVHRVALGTAITSVPMFFVTAAASMSEGTWTPVPSEVFELILAIWIIGGAYLFLWEKLSSAPFPAGRSVEAATPPIPNPPAEAASPRAPATEGLLFERLPPELGRDVICLGNEDHYVRVHTTLGNALILMRFADALDSLSAMEGQRVHRSWWVSRSAVVRIDRFGRTARLQLRNGLTVPVSQPYLALAKRLWGPTHGTVAA